LDKSTVVDRPKKPTPQEDLNCYLKSFPRADLLTPEQEIENGRILRNPDSTPYEYEKARDVLILHNTRLVVAEAMNFSKRAPGNVSVMDLISEGLFGLFDATRRYDPERPCKFSTYATWWIRRYIRKAITGARVIRIPYYMNGILSRQPWAECKLQARLGRTPTDEELAEEMDIRTSELTRTMRVSKSTKVFNPTSDSSEGSPMDAIHDGSDDPDLEGFFNNSRRVVWKILNRMEDQQAEILRLRYNIQLTGDDVGKKFTFSDIGHRLGMSREKARTLEKKALEAFLSEYTSIRQEVEDDIL